MPQIFTPVKSYIVLVCYIIAPVLAFCNAYGCGLTDWSLASTYGKLGLFFFAAWAGANGGVLVGLAVCGVMMSIVSTASDLMQDFKTGYLTLSSPRSMFVSQLVGTLMGCFLAPVTFWMFYKAFDLGDPNGEYPAPYAVVYRSMAVVGVEGFKVLPTHCLQLCYGFFAAGVAINAVRDLLPKKVSQYIPIPMAMAIPFYIGGYFAIDMFLGTVIKFYWERMNRKKSDIFTPAIAAGLICGDGVWTIPSAILALAKVNPPLCMQFLPAKVANAG
jgi:OPT family oligopeptide transporter